jgi:hypothetical protein
MLTVYTMANDIMKNSFERFCRFLKGFNPGASLKVIPFDEDIEKIEEISRIFGAELVPPQPGLDEIAQNVFGTGEYRPGIPSWRYARKINAFFGHVEPFIFLDCNQVVVHDLRPLVASVSAARVDMAFGARSMRLRSVPLVLLHKFYDLVSPGLGAGYNAAMFVSHGGAVQLGLMEGIFSARTRSLIGKAPEQGMLAYYLAISGRSHALLGDITPGCAPMVAAKAPIALRGDELMVGRRNVVYCIKYTGQEFKAEPELATRLLARRAAR